MTDGPQEHLLDWLRDAHAMEKQAEQMLESQIARLEHYPDLRRKLEEHLAETRRQATLVEDCIKRHGGDASAIKSTMGKMVAFGQGLSGLFVDDEVIKGTLASYTFEHMEIASYTILIAAAEAVGDSATAAICTRILREEEAMAKWLASQTPNLVRAFLNLDQVPGIAAKR
jgi:ferritin-like metal-binding protein YciE